MKPSGKISSENVSLPKTGAYVAGKKAKGGIAKMVE